MSWAHRGTTRYGMSRTDARPDIAVTSDHSLVAEAVSAALSSSDLVIVRVPWAVAPADLGALAGRADRAPDLALMLCDLDPASVDAARELVTAYPARWLLLTSATRGPLWGAMLHAGVEDILEGSTTLADLMEAIAMLKSGRSAHFVADRGQLVQAWLRDRARREDVEHRMNSLSQRELEVLQLLHLGQSVQEIAGIHEVACSTVRSQVRSMFRKLGVNSQLAAAAVLAEVQGG
jgi:DNA-binding NarL/FixJ family response regulator